MKKINTLQGQDHKIKLKLIDPQLGANLPMQPGTLCSTSWLHSTGEVSVSPYPAISCEVRDGEARVLQLGIEQQYDVTYETWRERNIANLKIYFLQ